MNGTPNKAILGERIFSGAASSALSIGLVLALVSLSGAGVVRDAARPMLSTFDLVQQSGGAEKPTPLRSPSKPETPSPQTGRPDLPELGRTPPSHPEPDGKGAQAPAILAEMSTPSRVLERPAVDMRPETPNETPSESQLEREQQVASRKQAKATSGTDASYKGEVWRHLQRFRRPNAVGPGSAFVSFTVGDSGNVIDLGIAQGSGSARFDGEALQMVRRAQPFPKPPQETGRTFIFEIKGR